MLACLARLFIKPTMPVRSALHCNLRIAPPLRPSCAKRSVDVGWGCASPTLAPDWILDTDSGCGLRRRVLGPVLQKDHDTGDPDNVFSPCR